MEEIKLSYLEQELENYKADNRHTVLRHALSKTSASVVVRSQDQIDDIDNNFDINIRTLHQKKKKEHYIISIFLLPTT